MSNSSSTTTQPASATAYTGRIVTIATLVVGLVGAAAPVALNLDLSSTAGVVAGIVALCAIIVKYLDGWQQYEARLDGAAPGAAGQAGAAPVPEGPATSVASATSATTPVSSSVPATADPAPAPVLVDPAEPDAPRPGEDDVAGAAGSDAELDDVPQAPSDDEIAAELALLDGQATGETGNGRGGRLTRA